MTSKPLTEVTGLLQAWSRGDRSAEQKLWPILYVELKRLAQREMQRERLSHTLQSGALVNELYMRLAGWEGAEWHNRAHFFGMCARIMRQVLVDHARARGYQKRGGSAQKISLNDATVAADFKDSDLLAVNEALCRFADLYPRQTQVVELRFFGGLSVEETAAALSVSHPTVIRDWKFARAWLMSSLNGQQNA